MGATSVVSYAARKRGALAAGIFTAAPCFHLFAEARGRQQFGHDKTDD
jgi:hypothetical protein